MRNEEYRQHESRHGHKRAKAATSVFGQLKVRCALHKLHTAEEVRQLDDHEAQKKQVDQTKYHDDLDRAEGEGVREQRVIDLRPVPLLLFGSWLFRLFGRLGSYLGRVGDVYVLKYCEVA